MWIIWGRTKSFQLQEPYHLNSDDLSATRCGYNVPALHSGAVNERGEIIWPGEVRTLNYNIFIKMCRVLLASALFQLRASKQWTVSTSVLFSCLLFRSAQSL
jgi:hypothetical protein